MRPQAELNSPGNVSHLLPTRRAFLGRALQMGLLAQASFSVAHAAKVRAPRDVSPANLSEALGINTSSFTAQLTRKGIGRNLSLLEVPKILRHELDLRVLDLSSKFFPLDDDGLLDRFRKAAELAGCTLITVKMSRKSDKLCDLGSHNRELRQKALADFKQWIDVASKLGTRFARPHPGQSKPESVSALEDGFRELSDYAGERKIGLLVENVGCIGKGDPNAIVKMVKAVGRNIAASPDIGNWPNDKVRFAALEASFPLAATCDFKFIALEPDGSHPLYDLEKCFRIGWNSGFRGPWNFEHADPDTAALFKKLGLMRDRLRRWMAELKK